VKLKNYFEELKRRHVFKSGIAYLIVAWLIAQIASIVLPAFEAPAYIMKILLFLLFIGFPVNLIISWIYDVTPEGIKKTKSLDEKSYLKNTRLNKVIVSSLVLAIIVVGSNFFFKEVMIPDKSIAVLAFADMSPDKDQEYFSDGISEELLNLLAKIPELKVISRTSSFSYKGKNTKATEIAKELNVSYILEGSIRKAGNLIRITAQLIRASDGFHEWSHTYDRSLDDIFKIQDDISAEVSKQLQLSILGKQDITKPINIKAYNLYLQAVHLVHQNTKESYITAEEKIKEALAIEENYAVAWHRLAEIYHTGVYNFSIREPIDGIPLGLEAAKKAIELDPNYAEAYSTLSSLQALAWDFDASAKNMKKALQLAPNNAVIIGTAALNCFGDLEKAISLQNKAIKLDPLVYSNYFNLGFANYRLNRLEEAKEAFDIFALYYPNWQIYHFMMAKVLLAQGKNDEALKEIEQETNEFFSLYGRNFVYFAMGRTEEANVLFGEFKEAYGATDPSNLADLYAFRGDFENSFKELGRALEIKDPTLMEILTYPSFKPMHSDLRWKAFINTIGFPKDHGYVME
jgi:TolB-like protein/Tfp pilus assembly protein PilF